MTTYALVVDRLDGEPSQINAYSSATNAIDDLEGLRAGGAVIGAILRDGLLIDEATLYVEEAHRALDVE